MTIAEEGIQFVKRLRSFVGLAGTPKQARDPVNQATIRNWCDAIGLENPVYTDPSAAFRSIYSGPIAPATMLPVWAMAGNIPREADPACPRSKVFQLLNETGYRSLIGTNTTETYSRPLRLGELLTGILSVVEVSDQKTTSLGTGYFVTTETAFINESGEQVGTWRLRTLNYKPRELTEDEQAKQRQQQAEQIPKHSGVRPRPGVMKETAFFWDGAKAGELRIQQCRSCHRLAHPPVVRCPQCGSFDFGYMIGSGKATLYSHVEPVYPRMPFMTYPYVVGLVELAEGTRLITNIVHCPPELVRIGMPLELVFQQTDPEMTLPMFRPVPPSRNPLTLHFADVEANQELPPYPLDVTSRLIIAGAIATRDFEDIHHEVAAARRAGLKDVFLNALTTNGLSQRYVENWAGPEVRIKAIDIRLGVPHVAGDTLTFSGRVTAKNMVDGRGTVMIGLRASNSKGDHAAGSMTIELPIGG